MVSVLDCGLPGRRFESTLYLKTDCLDLTTLQSQSRNNAIDCTVHGNGLVLTGYSFTNNI